MCMGDVNGGKAASLPAATHGGCTGFSLILTSSCVWASMRRRREEDSRGHLGGICFPFSAVTLFSIHALGGVDLLSLGGDTHYIPVTGGASRVISAYGATVGGRDGEEDGKIP